MPEAGTSGLTVLVRFDGGCALWEESTREPLPVFFPDRPTAGWGRRVNPRAGVLQAASSISSFIAVCLILAPSPNQALFSRLP